MYAAATRKVALSTRLGAASERRWTVRRQCAQGHDPGRREATECRDKSDSGLLDSSQEGRRRRPACGPRGSTCRPRIANRKTEDERARCCSSPGAVTSARTPAHARRKKPIDLMIVREELRPCAMAHDADGGRLAPIVALLQQPPDRRAAAVSPLTGDPVRASPVHFCLRSREVHREGHIDLVTAQDEWCSSAVSIGASERRDLCHSCGLRLPLVVPLWRPKA